MDKRLATTFTVDIIPQINRILKFALESPYSDFYRNKYKGLNIGKIESYHDFQKIPFLTKDEILAVPLEKRIFFPKNKVAYYSFSSGTARQGKPTIIPHSSFGCEANKSFVFNENKLIKIGVQKIMILMQPTSPVFIRLLSCRRKNITLIPANINDLFLAAEMAKEINIHGIFTTPTVLYFFISQLKEIGYDLKSIKWISLRGEKCSLQKLNYFKSEIPNAFMEFVYGNSETTMIGYRCDNLSVESPQIFHPRSSFVAEIAGIKNKILPLGESGELLYTSLGKRPFPLFRYKTNDIVLLEKSGCACGNNYVLTLEGRAEFDVLKFHGTTLYTEIIANAVSAAEEFVEPHFQMHVFEDNIGGKIKPKLELHLELKEKSKNLKEDLAFKKILADKISKRLWLSAKNTLKQLIDQNVFLPLQITFVDSWPKEMKSKNIISHLN